MLHVRTHYGIISAYADANVRRNECLEKANKRLQAVHITTKINTEEKADDPDLTITSDPDPSINAPTYYFFFVALRIGGFVMAGTCNLGSCFCLLGVLLLFFSIIACVKKSKEIAPYRQSKYEYEQSKYVAPPWRRDLDTSSKPKEVTRFFKQWQCKNCGELNNSNDLFCHSCGQYKK